MARRFCGEINIYIHLDECDIYQTRIVTPDGSDNVRVRSPNFINQSLDHPDSYDKAAQSALSFASMDGDDLNIEDHAAYSEDGFEIRRKKNG